MRKVIALLAASVLLLALFAGCGAGTDDGEKPVTIGVLAPLSGSETYYGKDMLQSYQLAVSEINAAGGVLGRQLVLYEQDDGAKPDIAVSAASKIISKGVDFVIGGYASGAIIPTMQLFNDAGLLLLISCANSTNITAQGFNQSFMINSPGTHAVVTLAGLLASLDAKKIALIHQGDDYTQNLAELCQQELPGNGFEIVTTQMIAYGEPDASAVVTAIRNAGADFVYWCGYHADGSNVIKQLRRGGYEGGIAVGDGSASPDLITACGADGEGVYVTSPPFVEFAEGGADFIAAYEAKFGMGPGNYATLCYDTVYLLKAAIEKANSFETDAVRNAVQGIEYKGLSGLIKFTPERELAVSNFIILQIKDGAFTLVSLD
jgi:branched-chain amino acid transport system substrate-binding protein